jgi:micrococcal nuclease
MRQVTRAIACAATHHTAWFWRGVSAIVGLILLTGHAAAASALCARGPHVGAVTHVRDGDTIGVAGLPIRLQGLAAPELSEPGGPEAARAMWMLLHGQEARCELTGEHSHDRCVGVCSVSGSDIAAELVRAGVARDCPRFSGGRYADEEMEAAQDGATIAETYRLPGYCRTR